MHVYSFKYLHVVGKFTHHTLELRGDTRVQLTASNGTTSGWHGNWRREEQLDTNASTLWVLFHYEGNEAKAVTVMFKACMLPRNTDTFQGTIRDRAHCLISLESSELKWVDIGVGNVALDKV